MSFSDSEGPSVSFTYNADGIRTSKTVGGIKHKYTLDGSRIVSETWTKNNIEYFLYFIYDENGSPAGIEYRTSEYEDGEFDYYFFDKNIFGDIIGIYNENGRKICTYTYNAWGECTTEVVGSASSLELHLANEYNPFRYRGYYYDIETKYYYLQTRYYNPEWGRFLNADGYINANGDILGYNMFAYCGNNPVMGIDPSGTSVTATFTVMLGFPALAFLVFTTCAMIAMMSTQSIAQQPTTYPDIFDKPIDQAQEKEEEKEVEKVKDGKLPSDNGQTYYHITTLENALNIYSTGTMYGSSYEGGRVYAWRMKPDKYAVKNSGAHQGVIISFKTNASFEQDSGIYDPRVTKYGPVVSSRPGPIYVWDVKIVGGY